jgi:ribosomal protein L31E
MNRITVEINPQEFKRAISKLPLKERIKFLEDMEEEFFPSRFREIISIIRSKVKKPLSVKKITQVCERVRKRLYEEETKSSN